MKIPNFLRSEPVILQDITPAPPLFKFTMPEERQFRPCEVDGRPAIFHRWVEEDKALLEIGLFVTSEEVQEIKDFFEKYGVVSNSTQIKIASHTFALVEYDDGTVGKVEPEKVKFTDRSDLT